MSITTLIIARHGNTFAPGEAPRRVGARTDLDLVESGIAQAIRLGVWFKKEGVRPVRVIAGPLKRTRKMAEIAMQTLCEGQNAPVIEIDERLREVDYGPDENLSEEDVHRRVGEHAIRRWDEELIVPEGWDINPQQIEQDWRDILTDIANRHAGETVLIVTSNGVARFAPMIAENYEYFKQSHGLKLATGALGILCYDGKEWHAQKWNVRPE